VAAQDISSIDVISEEVERKRQMQVAHFEALDAKAGLVMGFAGALVALAPAGSRVMLGFARAGAVASGLASLATFWPRDYWSTDLRPLRNKYLAAEVPFAKLHLLDTKIEMTERNATTLAEKASRLRIAMVLLAVAVLLTAIARGLE
jgi:hypothetical protein